MNRLVPYLDLFCRLSDEELSRLARAPVASVESLRQQIEEVGRALGRFADLLPRLSDEELTRLTGATVKTIRFWRLSQPRHLQGDSRRRDTSSAPMSPSSRELSAPYRGAEDSEVSSSSSSSSSSSARRRAELGAEQSGGSFAPELESDAGDSASFVIDTIE